MKADLSVGSTRSSIKQVYDVISAFDDKKKELVTSIGFGGFLFFPPLRQINRRFAVWLMSRVDPLSQMLVIDSAKRIKFNKVDIEHVFGIPCRGSSISDSGMPRKEIIGKVMGLYLGDGAKENRSIKAVQEVLERYYRGEMSENEQKHI